MSKPFSRGSSDCSTGACITAWEKIIVQQLDSRHKPCNFVGQLRLR
jgi:molybdenum cofactor biosynthesis protein B